MKVVVTGATGLVGGHVVREMAAAGHSVRALVRPESDRRFLADLDVEVAVGDVLQPDTLAPAVAGCEVVVHAAAIFAYWGHPATSLDTLATTGTRNVLVAAHRAGARRAVLTSSSVVVGADATRTVRDEASEAPPDTRIVYIESKRRQEQAAFATAGDLGLELVAVLPTICVGPYDRGPGESNAILTNYLADPYRTTWLGGCNVVAAADVGRGHVLASEHGQPGARYLLGGENVTWAHLHGMVSELCGIDGPLVTANHTASFLAGAAYELMGLVTGKRPPTTRAQARMVGRYYWYDHGRATAELGYRPRPARQALATALAWLVHSEHVPASVYQKLRLTPEVMAAHDDDRRDGGR